MNTHSIENGEPLVVSYPLDKTLEYWIKNDDTFTPTMKAKLNTDSYKGELDVYCDSLEEVITSLIYIARIKELYEDVHFWQGVREGLRMQKHEFEAKLKKMMQDEAYKRLIDSPVVPPPPPYRTFEPYYEGKPYDNSGTPNWPRPGDVICKS